mmetsp:Transcript_47027/g.114296  ORF Transcript_47027/g.114296 Transcript_47027/m.114296 type:complete len:229 (-) Transcript_47027:440-1126(-)
MVRAVFLIKRRYEIVIYHHVTPTEPSRTLKAKQTTVTSSFVLAGFSTLPTNCTFRVSARIGGSKDATKNPGALHAHCTVAMALSPLPNMDHDAGLHEVPLHSFESSVQCQHASPSPRSAARLSYNPKPSSDTECREETHGVSSSPLHAALLEFSKTIPMEVLEKILAADAEWLRLAPPVSPSKPKSSSILLLASVPRGRVGGKKTKSRTNVTTPSPKVSEASCEPTDT